MTDLLPFERPQLEEKDIIQARMDAAKLIRKYGMRNLQRILSALVVENVRLVKEIQIHRVARGLEPLEIFEV